MTVGIGPAAPDVPDEVARRYEALVFDWDGTAVPGRKADAGAVRKVVERLCELGMYVAVVSGTHVGNVDGQLGARPAGPGRLVLALNRGSEVFEVGPDGHRLVYRREATRDEDTALTRAAELTVRRLAERGLTAEIVSSRLNRRKVDLIPLPEWSDPPRSRLPDLLDAVLTRLHGAGVHGLREAVELALDAAHEAGLAAPRVTSDAKHVEIGLTDKADSAHWILRDLASRGIGPGAVLLGGDEFGPLGGLPGSDSLMLVEGTARSTAISVGAEPGGVPDGVHARRGGPATFLAILRDQVRRREAHAVPVGDEDPHWTIVVEGSERERERAAESVLSFADGRIGTRGAPLACPATATPSVVAAGVYDRDDDGCSLVQGPLWSQVTVEQGADARLRRVLDLRAGLLHEVCESDAHEVSSVRFASFARPGTAVLRASGLPQTSYHQPLTAPPTTTAEAGERGDVSWLRVDTPRGSIAAASSQDVGHGVLDRVTTFTSCADGPADPEAAMAGVDAVRSTDFERLLCEHRTAWGARWDEADVVIEGDDELQQAVRFALFHLMGSVADRGEAALGARGLSGPGYRGHVFWDGDVFVLPFLAATHPEAARSMLEYRIRRLPQARAAARARALRGARFPWESAGSGGDVTPQSARDRSGRIIPIRNGLLEEHIVADVAWAACCYADWSGDDAFLAGHGAPLLVDTARYWASRIRVEPDGSAHIYGVIGPDEYHEPVDDNAYTNVMARWNLRRAAATEGVDDLETRRWLELADALVDGYDADTGVYEQFAGFRDLEPLLIAETAPHRPIAADALLGRERTAAAQVVKQADVLMLHHLVPDEVAAGSLEPNLRYYEPRTAHGSSLSPGIHASLFARVRDFDRALELLRLAARVDLDDVTATTAGGLHVATMGGLWQALAYGVAGIRPTRSVLRVDPNLPPSWSRLVLTIRFRGSRITIETVHDELSLEATEPVDVAIGPERFRLGVSGARFRRHREDWERT